MSAEKDSLAVKKMHTKPTRGYHSTRHQSEPLTETVATVRIGKNRDVDHSYIPVGMENGTVTLENGLAVSQTMHATNV